MCQVSAFVADDAQEELLKENVTSIEMLDAGIRMSTLFEGSMDYSDLHLRSIDFSAGKVVLAKNKD